MSPKPPLVLKQYCANPSTRSKSTLLVGCGMEQTRISSPEVELIVVRLASTRNFFLNIQDPMVTCPRKAFGTSILAVQKA
ncbi:hypothetical protein FGO68_gene9234 [Halteria grandinella]|uniref:Uncharacterized protein n=1 Tax=Halteria grandinella TaxID=5974 RepID=A0A8J8N9G5_HALGN|nr:hypothetical protein FGO68_gene9234 [Halteria grandinella]